MRYGTLVGVLPGISPLNTTAMLLPFTFGLAPTSAMIMLAGIFYGAQYGGSTTAILVNVPGETSAVVTCLDGYQMARQGKAGPALAIAAIASFFAGCVATVVIALLSEPLAALALKFTAPEYFSLLIMGLIAAVVLAHGSPFKAIAMVLVGIMTGLVGMDVNAGVSAPDVRHPRHRRRHGLRAGGRGALRDRRGRRQPGDPPGPQHPDRKDQEPDAELGRLQGGLSGDPAGNGVGTILGILPGGGAALPPFAAYALEKKVSRHPERFGTGDHPGGGSPGVGQQRRRADQLHPAS